VLQRRGAWPPSRLLALLLLALLPAVAVAQDPRPADELSVHVLALKHQSASEAMALVLPMLSARGTVELRREANTLVLRDTRASLERILPLLYGFDHPRRDVDVELWLIHASTGVQAVSPAVPPDPSNVPPALLRSLAGHFRYGVYRLVAESRVRSREGQRVTFELAGQYTVRFRLGTVVGERRLRLNEFEVLQRNVHGEAETLARSNLNLWLDRNMVFALAAGESSPSSLMVVVRCRPAAKRDR
jgi:hypothetical protein